jgi:hypothetical protein
MSARLVRSIVLLGSLAGAALALGCTAHGGRPDVGGGSYPDGGGPDAWMRPDYGFRDPFDPDASCGASAIPTQRIPGSLLLVFDRSSSMDEDVNGHRSGDTGFMAPTKWDASTMAIDAALTATGDDLSVGLLLFPTNVGNVCDVALGPGVPQVEVAPLLTNRSVISSALSGGPNGGNTPLYAAMWAGYNYLDTLSTPGQRGLVVVTDGAENCDHTAAGRQAILDEVQRRHDTDGYITFAVGLTTTDSFLSSVALNGGTARDATCVAECVAPPTACTTDADCATGMGPCLLGFCIRSGGSTGECCNYSIGTASFRTDFQAALDEIARHFLESCVFELPRGADPTRFDPNRVNVGVTFTGESRTVLGRSSDSTVDSWDYTSPAMDSIVIQGAICDRLLTGDAQVEIVLGCPTIVI